MLALRCKISVCLRTCIPTYSDMKPTRIVWWQSYDTVVTLFSCFSTRCDKSDTCHVPAQEVQSCNVGSKGCHARQIVPIAAHRMIFVATKSHSVCFLTILARWHANRAQTLSIVCHVVNLKVNTDACYMISLAREGKSRLHI